MFPEKMRASGKTFKSTRIIALLVIGVIIFETVEEVEGVSRPYFRNKYPNKNFHISRAISSRQCDGEENLKHDLCVLSFKLSTVSSVAGLFSLTEFSIPSNDITIISTVLSLILWVPSAVLTFLATSDPLSWITGNLVNVGSLIVTLYGGFGFIPGTLDIFLSTVDEVLGITALILSSLTTFPNMYSELKTLLQDTIGKEEVDAFLRGYGCGGPNSFGGALREMVLEGMK